MLIRISQKKFASSSNLKFISGKMIYYCSESQFQCVFPSPKEKKTSLRPSQTHSSNSGSGPESRLVWHRLMWHSVNYTVMLLVADLCICSLQIEADPQGSSVEDKLNVATEWTSEFPAMFHIILWLTVALILLVILVSYGMANTDPGNDSIIYRMTTTRLKRD